MNEYLGKIQYHEGLSLEILAMLSLALRFFPNKTDLPSQEERQFCLRNNH